MRHPISKIAALALVAPLAGSMLFAPAASAAPAKAPAAAVVAKKADDPFSIFAVTASATKKVRPGGKITFTVKAKNTGPHLATAGTYFIVGYLPKGVDISKATFSGPKDSFCDADAKLFACAAPYDLEVDDYVTFQIKVKAKKTAKGTLKTALGVVSYDVPTGAENLDRDELERMGIKSWFFGKEHKIKVVR
ncbi:hypothetical protein HS041_05830 [Planomonospora sp. ID67723]|uniref:DUF11 domain-containing protein n=1 Tax=Planomonospora sp. ID67723 TaxID=2738134 RepID=UPI0018C374FB|nr:DUF11 domain-containing protein [Planomonospora sp. ID67723]MBG0827279.1 hypothetical protein [Planomonospora sp. ID67723]